MSCLSNYTLRGVFNDCRANLAGVKRIYLTYWDDVVPQVDYTTHTITGYTLEEGAAWYRYDFAKNTASLTSTLTKDDAAGLRYYTNAISASFSKMDRANHLEFMALAAEKLAAVIVTNNGDSWYVGLDGYVGSSNQEAGTGTGPDDRNGYTIQLDCTSKWLPFRFTAEIEPEPGPTPPTPTPSVSITSTSAITYDTTQINWYVNKSNFIDAITVSLIGNGTTQTMNLTGLTGQVGVQSNFTIPINTGDTITYTLTVSLPDYPGYEDSTTVEQEEEPTPTAKYVQDLVDEGYANVVTGAGGTYIEILSGTPYAPEEILDLAEVARNEKKLTGTTNNVILWDQPLPSGWGNDDIVEIYSGQSLNFTPRARMLWALGDIDNFEITFSGGSYNVNDYPWGSGGQNNGIFAPRYNTPGQHPSYFTDTPKNLTVNFSGSYGSIAQTMFAEMHTTTALTINVDGFFSVVDWTGMYEDCYNLQTLTINGMFRYDFTRLCHNMFKNCEKLTSVPYFVAWGRDHAQNTVAPHTQPGGSADAGGMFQNCQALTAIGLTLDFRCISLSGCTVDGETQAALSAPMIECPNLTDVRIKNLGHNDWDFTNANGKLYAPKMDAASIDYLLNNVQTVNNLQLTLPSLHRSEISSSAITNAESKGWTISWN